MKFIKTKEQTHKKRYLVCLLFFIHQSAFMEICLTVCYQERNAIHNQFFTKQRFLCNTITTQRQQ